MPGRNFGMERARGMLNDPNFSYPGSTGDGYGSYGYNSPPMQYAQNYPQLQYEQSGYMPSARPPAGKFDGPMDNSAHRRNPSQNPQGMGNPGHSRGPSQNPFPQGVGYDPARGRRPDEMPRTITNTRVELPPEAYALDGQKVSA